MTILSKHPGQHRRFLSGMLLLLATTTCQAPPPSAEPEHAAAPADTTDHADLTLKAIMQGLEADMAAAAHGIWVEDREAVAVAAGRVADHPHVTPREMGIIQATLGEEFAAFVGHDQKVHGLAVALAEAAVADADTDLLAGYIGIQQGCVACHAQFRARITEALKSPAG